ncbi:hypothetical protein CCR94_16315 [Rhodoblastus sphagnicola]|uniref:Mu-like prophage FluMu N-terminal domain-containing protein n=1 Tax=Rhodoblastus sphagnicola TaxID=333368 RepID=A0A2S6N2V4_9HYPH|nr:hypothetical protein [Rhodoblastus sphagnicola]MBB4199059.1 hypothetical protein [Rhodoblastus sphagnicola]PPQ28954.1 hypothetical protein CCR94_16315 [Rhodoblastus sphagnicola]
MAKTPKSTQAENEEAAPEMAGAPGEKVKVRGPEDGRWRGGVQFGPTEREIDLSEITAEAFAEIEADSYLEVRWVEPAPAPEPETPKAPEPQA